MHAKEECLDGGINTPQVAIIINLIYKYKSDLLKNSQPLTDNYFYAEGGASYEVVSK